MTTYYPSNGEMSQLFAYGGLEKILEDNSKYLENRSSIIRTCKAGLKTAILLDRNTRQLESVRMGVRPNLSREEQLLVVEGTLFHVTTCYLEELERGPYRGWERKDVDPKERLSTKEKIVKVLMPPMEYKFDPYRDMTGTGRGDYKRAEAECADAFRIDDKIMKAINSAMDDARHGIEPSRPGWPKTFDIGRGRTVVIGGPGRNKLVEMNVVWEADAEKFLTENTTYVFERRIIDFDKYGIFLLNKEGQLTEARRG